MEPRITAAELREQCDRLGLTPPDDDLEAVLPAVEALLDFADEIRQMVPQDAEPGTALRLTE